MNQYAFADNLHNTLVSIGMTQTELAKQIDSDNATVSRWMTGTRLPSVPLLYKVSKVTGVSMDKLMEGYEA